MLLNKFSFFVYEADKENVGTTEVDNVEVTEVNDENVEQTEVEEVVTKKKTAKKKEASKTKTETNENDEQLKLDNEKLKADNQKLKVESKLVSLCNNNDLDVDSIKLLLPNYENMEEEAIESFVTNLVSNLPKLTKVVKPASTPRIVPNSSNVDPRIREKQLHQKYFGNRGGL